VDRQLVPDYKVLDFHDLKPSHVDEIFRYILFQHGG